MISGSSPKDKIIRAKQILITVPPTLECLTPSHLDAAEKSIFGEFKWLAYITEILKKVDILTSKSFANTNPANHYGLPKLRSL